MDLGTIIAAIIGLVGTLLGVLLAHWLNTRRHEHKKPLRQGNDAEGERLSASIRGLSPDAQRLLWQLSIKGNPITLSYEWRNSPTLAMLESAGLIHCVREGSHHDNFTDVYAVDEPIRAAIQNVLKIKEKQGPHDA